MNKFWCSVQILSFAEKYVLVQESFVKRSILSSLNSVGTFVEYQLATKSSFYSWSLNSNFLIHMSLLVPAPHSLNCCNSVVSFEIKKCEPSPLCSF